ncbi:hypothetical protein BH20ACT15_BH20ACT15_02550 [soil metagenome]
MRFDDAGLIREMAVYVRPASGINALADEMRRMLEELGAAQA